MWETLLFYFWLYIILLDFKCERHYHFSSLFKIVLHFNCESFKIFVEYELFSYKINFRLFYCFAFPHTFHKHLIKSQLIHIQPHFPLTSHRDKTISTNSNFYLQTICDITLHFSNGRNTKILKLFMTKNFSHHPHSTHPKLVTKNFTLNGLVTTLPQ